jgi:hypothetical protein
MSPTSTKWAGVPQPAGSGQRGDCDDETNETRTPATDPLANRTRSGLKSDPPSSGMAVITLAPSH